jgi:hypothetical protein
MAKYRFTVEVDTVDELVAQLQLLLATASSTIAQRDGPDVPPGGRVCPNGHGAMGLIPAGVTRSGPRIGQPYSAFLKCATCGTRMELTA